MQNYEGENDMVIADSNPSFDVWAEVEEALASATEASVKSLWDEHMIAWLAPRVRGVSDFPRPTSETEDPFIIVACF